MSWFLSWESVEEESLVGSDPLSSWESAWSHPEDWGWVRSDLMEAAWVAEARLLVQIRVASVGGLVEDRGRGNLGLLLDLGTTLVLVPHHSLSFPPFSDPLLLNWGQRVCWDSSFYIHRDTAKKFELKIIKLYKFSLISSVIKYH